MTDLPRVSSTRLQRTIADLEFGTEFDDFESLCAAAEATQWAENLELDAKVIGKLILAHGTITKVSQPEGTEPVEAPSVEKDTAKPKKAKRGKTCPGCGETIGTRSRTCKHCGFDFDNYANETSLMDTTPDPDPPPDSVVEKVKSAPSGTVKHRDYDSVRMSRIWAPAGACPHRLDGTDEDTVRRWAERVRDTAQQENKFLTVHALEYYARQFYDIFGDEWKTVKAHLQAIYAHEIH